MNFQPAFVIAFAFMLAAAGAGQAPADSAPAEIEYLLGYVENSGYKFIRSGKEYTAAEGAEHMRTKLQRAGARVKSADDFVRGVASKSYLTGDSYLVKAPDGRQWPTGEWLSKALEAYRKAKR